MKKRIIAMLMILVLMMGILPVAALATVDADFDVAVFWYDFADAWLSNVRAALDNELEAAGVEWTNYDATMTQATQNDQIDTAISQGANVLVVNIVDTAVVDAAQAIVDKAAAAGLPVIFFNREVDDYVINSYENACFVGTKAAEAGGKQGKMAGDYIANNYDEVDLNGDGYISYIMMKGELGNPEAEMRTRYAVEFCNNALIAAGKPELVYYDENNTDCFQPSNWSKVQAFNLMETALYTNPMDSDSPIEVVFANNDDAALGCIEALNNADWNTGEGNFIPVFGIDCTADAMAAMEAGKMTGSVLQSADGMAETVAALVGNVANGEHVFANAYDNFNVDNTGVAKIRVPYEMILEGEIYESDYDYDYDYDDSWGDFEGASGECGDNLTWVIDSDWNLTISGEGAMWDYPEEWPTWTYYTYYFNDVVIEEGVTHIGSYAFFNNEFNNISIPSTVSSIGEMAFTETFIYGGIWVDAENENYSSDGFGVLYNGDMTELIHVHDGVYGTYYVPTSVDVIKDNALYGGWNIYRLIFEGDAPEFEEAALHGFGATIFYPENNPTWTEEVMQDYAGYATWLSYDPEEPDFTLYGECGDNLTWAFDEEGTLTISGEGEMWNFTEEWSTWHAYADAIENVVIEDGVTTIGAYAFEQQYLYNITIPASVERIAPSAFLGCYVNGGIWVDEDNQNYCNDEYGVLFEEDLEVLMKAPWGIYDEYIVPEGVVAIEAGAFDGCDFEGVVLPESLEVISEGAFTGCWNFTTIYIPAGVNIIGSNAFNGCNIEEFVVDEDNEFYSNDEYGVLFNKEKTELIQAPWTLYGVYVVPEGVEVIGGNAFAMGYNLYEIELPSTLSYIAAEAFSGCYSVTEITLPENVRFVGDWAFCDGLYELTVKGDNTTFSEYAFNNCLELQRIVFEGNAPKIFGFDFFWPNTIVYYPEGNETWTEEFMEKYYGDATFVEYDPENPDFSIRGECGDNLTWTLSDDGVLTISGEGAMWDYDYYDGIVAPWYDFSDMIYAIIIEEGVTSIDDWAFEGCYNVETISIPNTVTYIGEGAINYCDSLTDIYIPASVSVIDINNFRNCENMTGIWVDEENANYSSDENGVLFNKDMTELVKLPCGYVGDYIVPENVITIGRDAFGGCSYLTSVTIHSNVTNIEDFAFFASPCLSEIVVDEDNEYYTSENGVLYDKDMRELLCVPGGVSGVLTVPDSVTYINWAALMDEYYLEAIKFEGDIPGCGSSIWLNTTIYYPLNNPTWTDESMQIFKGDITWIGYDPENPDLIASGECGENLTWTLDMFGILTISGEGAMWDFGYDMPPWFGYINLINSAVIEEGVTSVGNSAFFDHSYLTDVSIPASVTEINDYFELCYELTSITVDENNENYSSDENGVLFNKDMTELLIVPRGIYGEYVVPDGVVTIAYWAINGFDRLTSLVIPASVENIEEYAIVNSDALEEIVVDEDNEYYSTGMFGVLYNKDKTELVLVPEGYEGFEFTIPASVESIQRMAIDDIPNVEELIFEGDAPSFDGWLWRYFTIYYPENNPTWTEDVMASFGEDITWIPYTTYERPEGDVNGDGEVTNADVITMARYLVELPINSPEDVEEYGDVSDDGIINNLDLVILVRRIVERD